MPSHPGPGSKIAGIGAYAPERVLTNSELEKMVDTSDQWITERTGIKQRRIAAPDENASDMAVAAANNPQNSSVESIRTGIAMISTQLKSAMADAGLEEIDAASKPFDANWHEAVSQQESAEAPEGHVLQQLRKGYKLRDRLLRPATVVIAKKPAA